MNLAQYLATTVTPLYAVVIEGEEPKKPCTAHQAKQSEEMMQRYRNVFTNRAEMTSQEVGAALGISKPLIGLRKMEARGFVRMVRMSADKRGRKQAVWEWIK
jgi:predicted ArsR family transcriptional regulator